MKRTLTIALAVACAAALFAGLVYTVLVAAHVSDPAAQTVHGMTARRLWATTAVLLGLVGVTAGGLAVRRSSARLQMTSGRMEASVAFGAGLIALLNGGLNVVLAEGGPGSGNGVVGGAAAFVLGLTALVLGARGLARSRSAVRESGQAA